MSATSDLNYIKKIFAHPCAVPSAQVLVETGFAAASVALIELTTAGCLDILKLKAGKHFFHHKGLNGLIKQAAPAQAKGAFNFAFSLGFGTVEGLLNYFFLIGVGTSFVANFQSLIYINQKCDLPGAGYFTCPISSFYAREGFEADMLLNGLSSSTCARVGSNEIVIPAGCYCTISYEAPWLPFQNDPANMGAVETWLEYGDGQKLNLSETTRAKAGDTLYTAGGLNNVSGYNLGERHVRIRYRIKSGFMGCSAGVLRISAYGRPISLIPTGCKPKKLDEPPYPTPEPQPPPFKPSIDDIKALYDQTHAYKNARKQPRPKRKKPPYNPRPKPRRPRH